jgi:hypothetical protein
VCSRLLTRTSSCLSVYPCIHLSIYPSIHLSIYRAPPPVCGVCPSAFAAEARSRAGSDDAQVSHTPSVEADGTSRRTPDDGDETAASRAPFYGARVPGSWILGDDRVMPPPSQVTILLGSVLLSLYHSHTSVVSMVLTVLESLVSSGYFLKGAWRCGAL